jgi:glyoxylase-like metal-dependent hydrolase (beta-lactamase superfamily II)
MAAMKTHHLNCGSVRQIDAPGLPSAHAVNHCLLAETDHDGLVLVETGLGLADVRDPAGTLGGDWVAMAQPLLAEDETAVRQIARLGFAPEDVRHVVVTHLDVDHCGGLPDFPDARVHVLAAERDAALAEAPSFRYRPAHWAHGPKWETYAAPSGDDWFGFASVPLTGVDADIRLVPLGGHTAGHAGVAVHDGHGWLLHCGDAYYYHRELAAVPEPHPVLDVVQTRSEIHHDLRLGTQARLRELLRRHGGDVTVFSAHDPWELDRLRG